MLRAIDIIPQIRAMAVRVVGMRFHDFGEHWFTINDTVTLEQEPDNKHDAKAVKVLLGGVHAAYIAKPQNADVFDIIEQCKKNGKDYVMMFRDHTERLVAQFYFAYQCAS